ncbi:DUF2357 domain-containing protein [Thermococcus barophilus]|uniref:DUF2357 domain-containing protein n=1 Tax=Thermococcus barophilus (strain DSM 11836 / MP) TaxID=391623 RepID=F0LN67_THEBM|nr:DUF2357 domain-containing protein [Thermococcus barophilus]ADT85206.1 hypothetical protein TERMP_02233 [Thermococcus barophilus MP]
MEKSRNKNFLPEISLDKGGKYQLKAKKKKESIIKDAETLYLFEWQEYMIIGEKEFSVRIGDEKIEAEKINENTYIATFQFKNYIGKTHIEILEGTKPISLEFKNFEVLSEKVGKIYNVSPENTEELIQKHEELYNALLKYISEKSISLPFSVSAPTAFGVEESEEPMSELFVYHFLVNNRERIISAYEEIIRRPHRKLVEREEWLNFWEVSEVDEDTVMSIITHPEYLIKAEPSSIAVAEYLNNHVPTKVAQRIKYESFDTHENRFAKHFLNELITWGEKAIAAILTSSYLTKEQKENATSKLTSILGELEYYATSDIFDDVGEMVIFPYTSQVLLKREGYRDLLQLWREFRSYSPFFDEMQKAIDNKDIAKLYEYWCFFKLVEELGKILGQENLRIIVEPTGELSERGHVYAEFDNGWRLYYNLKKRGYSVSLRPDFLLLKGRNIIGVFDAKFKLDVVDVNEFAEEDREMERAPNFQTWAKLEDIYKMHTYRDALNAKFAVVLYPGDRSLFFDKISKKCIGDLKECKGKFDLRALLDRDNVKLEGIGYLSCKP